MRDMHAVRRSMASQGSRESSYKKRSVVRGHHIYKRVWTPVVGEELSLKTEDGNLHDKHAVAVIKDRQIVDHVPRSISKVSWFFLKHGGKITCRITGGRTLGVGLEVPCVYSYSASVRMIQRLKKRLAEDSTSLTHSCPH